MKILDPLTGETHDIPNLVSLDEERAKRRKDYPKPVPVLDKGWDDEIQQHVDTIFVGGKDDN